MKKILSVALCAAMILAAAGISYSADTTAPQTSPKTIQVLPAKTKPIKPISRVTDPEVPEEIDQLYTYLEENQTPAAFIKSMQKFGAKTSALLLKQSNKNQTYSPVSFAYALGVLGSGAQGQTAKDIAKALEVTNMKTAADGFFKFYNSNYNEQEDSILKIANSLWMQKNYPIKSTFAKNAADQFYASSYSVDFSKQATADAMAKWISEQTGGLLNPNFEPDEKQVLSIINTLYFQGSWASAFQAKNNTVDKFNLADGSQIDVTYMNQEFENASYYETADYTLFQLPFSNGQKMSFVLPKEGDKLSSILDEDSLDRILALQDINNSKRADVTIKLPKFSYDSEFNLNDTCKALGLESLFDGRANLSGITDNSVSVSNVKQESHLEIDENGCKAAAYTKMDIMKMSMPVEMEKYTFSLDRPFLFVLESNDNAPLFVGTVYNPAE